MKLLGIDYILSVSAVGSLQEKYAPTDMVIPDQFFDRTRARAEESNFFRQRNCRAYYFFASGLPRTRRHSGSELQNY